MAESKRFCTVQEEDFPALEEQPSNSTKRVVRHGGKLFVEYLQLKGLCLDTLVKSPHDLNQELRYFYVSVKQQTGSDLKRKSLDSLKYGLTKYLLKNYNVDLKDKAYQSSNATFLSKVKHLKKTDLGNVKHKPLITKSDFEKLCNDHKTFDIETPNGLQNKVWFDLTYYLLRASKEKDTSRQSLRAMTKLTFQVSKDLTGRKFVYRVHGKPSKNLRYE